MFDNKALAEALMNTQAGGGSPMQRFGRLGGDLVSSGIEKHRKDNPTMYGKSGGLDWGRMFSKDQGWQTSVAAAGADPAGAPPAPMMPPAAPDAPPPMRGSIYEQGRGKPPMAPPPGLAAPLRGSIYGDAPAAAAQPPGARFGGQPGFWGQFGNQGA